MFALKKINNNFVLCQDEAGEEIVAMGKGLGFGELPREISIKEVERTFYDVDERYLSSVQSIPQPKSRPTASRIASFPEPAGHLTFVSRRRR